MTIKIKIVKAFLRKVVRIINPKKIRRWQYICSRTKNYIEEILKMNNALILYFSKTGNTEKIALAIKRGLEKEAFKVTIKRIEEAKDDDFYDYDLVCFGSPVHHALPPAQVIRFIKIREKKYRSAGEVYLATPIFMNKRALIFCTYSGPHCGISEALPTGKYIRQFFEHLGFAVIGEWYDTGEYHEWERGSLKGKMGDIRGRPNVEDLAMVELKTIRLVRGWKTI